MLLRQYGLLGRHLRLLIRSTFSGTISTAVTWWCWLSKVAIDRPTVTSASNSDFVILHNIYSSGLLWTQFPQKVFLSMYTSRRMVFLANRILLPLNFTAQQQACIQIAVTIYTQACPRTSWFCFLLYQLSLWWVKYRAQPEAINPWKHAGRNAPWQTETSWDKKVKPRKSAWNQAFLWLSILFHTPHEW